MTIGNSYPAHLPPPPPPPPRSLFKMGQSQFAVGSCSSFIKEKKNSPDTQRVIACCNQFSIMKHYDCSGMILIQSNALSKMFMQCRVHTAFCTHVCQNVPSGLSRAGLGAQDKHYFPVPCIIVMGGSLNVRNMQYCACI